MIQRLDRILVGCVLLAGTSLAPACTVVGGSDGGELDEIAGGGGGGHHGGNDEGEELFEEETFGGNGRTCATCHPSDRFDSGTLAPCDVQHLFLTKPNDPLFQHDAADVIGGNTFNRIRTHATILMQIPLPANVSIVGSSSRTAILARGIPTTMNTPALDPVLMYDGREPNLEEQARSAILQHAQTDDVADDELEEIAEFQQEELFNRKNLEDFAKKGKALKMPFGHSQSEKRGRRFFIADGETSMDQVGETFEAQCGWCHSGNFLNETSEFFQLAPEPNVPPGTRFLTVLVENINAIGNPVQTFRFDNGDGTFTDVTSPDPGQALITGNAADTGFPGSGLMRPGSFKIPTVWGIKDTAPYFHDNSSKTLGQLMDHYQEALITLSDGIINLTDQDKADIEAYMKLL